jgi:hypothetical protein
VLEEAQRRVYELAAELGDLQVRQRQTAALTRQAAEQARQIDESIEAKHADIAAAMRLRDRIQLAEAAATSAAAATPPDAKVMA